MGQRLYLVIRDGHGLPEDDPLHNFTTRWGGQGTCVPVVAAQGCRQEVPEDERVQEGLLLCLGKADKKRHHQSRCAADSPSEAGWRHITSLACACLCSGGVDTVVVDAWKTR